MMSSRDFVYRRFAEFYGDPSTIVPSPAMLNQRELGFLLFKEHIMLRHKIFANINDLRLFLSEVVPSDVYYSCAYYDDPDAEMDKKGWLGADLVFDIDADHIPTACDKYHDEWNCKNCGLTGRGMPPKRCPKCDGARFDTKTWPCERCLDSAKKETAKLIDMLKSDFGFSDEEIQVFFSGHRGYHVHIENETVKSIDAMGRKEIVDYIIGLGLTLGNSKKVGRKGKRYTERFLLSDFAWDRRIKLGMREFILNSTKEDLKKAGIGKNSAAILRNRDLMVKRGIDEGKWSSSIKGVNVGTWRKLAEYVKDIESAKIDTVVTTDTHRLIRMNGTLHGKTGLKKVEFPAKRLADFDPFEEAVAFKGGGVNVFVSDAPEFRLRGKVFGPYKQQTVEVPTAAAVLLICKGRAEVAT